MIEAYGTSYVYEVQTSRQSSPASQFAFQSSDIDMLTLVTCESFDASSEQYAKRRIVSTVLIDIH